MELLGRVHDVHRDYITRKPVISFLLNTEPNGIESLNEKELMIKVSKVTKRRSLDSNAYFHVLCDKLRIKLGISMAECKNALITSYGQVMYMDDVPLIYKTNAPPEFIRMQEEPHMLFIKQGDDNAYWYRMYRGSHTYNVQEMQKLIEGTVTECRNMGIEVATPEELMKMQQLWKTKFEGSKENG